MLFIISPRAWFHAAGARLTRTLGVQNFAPTSPPHNQPQMQSSAQVLAESIYAAATPVLHIQRLTGPRWKRKIEKNPCDARIGPWLQAQYTVVNDAAWRNKGACLYLVKAAGGPVRYVGISRNGMKHRWRTSPSYHADTMVRLSEDQLFHSQCWKHMEAAASTNPAIQIEVRCIQHEALAPELARLGPPLSGFLALGDDGEGTCAAVERWLCNRSEGQFLSWNTAMTGRTKGAAQPILQADA